MPREGLIRMLNTGTIDSSFRPPARRYSAMALAGGKLYVADDDLRQLSRLDPLSGDPVAGFTPIGYALSVTSLQAAGPHVYLVGNYNLTGIAPPLGRFARMHVATDSLDNSFRFAADAGGGIVGVSADAASNSLFLYGSFNTLNGLGPARLARIDASTLAIDPAFNANVGGFVAGALIDDAGGVFISGGFTTVGAQTCRAPARVLLATGARDVAFACSANLGGNLLALSADAVYVAATSQIRRFARTAGGVTDPNWRVSDMPQQINGLQTFGRDLFVHGRYDHISGATRRSLAALPQVELFGRSGFE